MLQGVAADDASMPEPLVGPAREQFGDHHGQREHQHPYHKDQGHVRIVGLRSRTDVFNTLVAKEYQQARDDSATLEYGFHLARSLKTRTEFFKTSLMQMIRMARNCGQDASQKS